MVEFTEVSAPTFVRAITDARRRRRIDPEGRTRLYGETVHQYTPEEYGWMRCFLTPKGGTGFALKQYGDDVDLVSVFSASSQLAGIDAVTEAVRLGATTVDVFDEHDFLPRLYRRAGFEEVGRLAWDDRYAPDPWNGDTPDVVYMRLVR